MTEDQEVRARALEIAIQYKGESHLKFDTLFRFAGMFGKYIATGDYERALPVRKPLTFHDEPYAGESPPKD